MNQKLLVLMTSSLLIESSLITIHSSFAYEKSHERIDTRVVRQRVVRICAAGQKSRRGARRQRRQTDFQIHLLEKVIFIKRKILGRYIVADPNICHVKPTFRGTRIMVWQVLDQVANRMSWDTIIEESRGGIAKAAIAEAIRLSSKAFIKHADKYSLGPTAA